MPDSYKSRTGSCKFVYKMNGEIMAVCHKTAAKIGQGPGQTNTR